MAFIQFFDITENDRRQLDEMLRATDHSWEFVEDHITSENLNPEAEMISVFVSSTVTAELMDRLPKLRLISCRSTGFNNVDIAAAEDRQVTVTNVPSYGDHTVAEYVFTLLLALTRKLLPTQDSMRSGDVKTDALTGIDLNGKTFGIIGAGRIGQATARIAKGFGMQVVAHDPYPKPEAAEAVGFTYVSLNDLLASSDVVSLHSPYTGENRHLIGADKLGLMKSDSILINTARGELVDTKALIEALRNQQLSAAALDVFEGEKLIDIDEEMLLLRQTSQALETLEQSVELSILAKMPNVIITPHNAFNTVEAIGRINNTTFQNLTRYWYGETPNKVTPPEKKAGKLILVRHGESEWNALGKWTGTRDVHLTEKGFKEASRYGIALKDIHIDFAYASHQIRTLETLEGILNASQQFDVPYERVAEINERDYGDYTGKNKWEMQQMLGEEAFHSLRRDWDCPVPNGETLKMVYERVQPFYMKHILPKLLEGKNVLVVSHGNSLRALIKYIEDISDTGVADVEMLFGNVLIYDVDENGHRIARDERTIAIVAPPA